MLGVAAQERAAGQPRKTREEQAADQARELLVFADGIEDAGHPDLARRSRNVARETLWLVETVANERSARKAIQQARDGMLQTLANRVFCNRCRDAMKQAAE